MLFIRFLLSGQTRKKFSKVMRCPGRKLGIANMPEAEKIWYPKIQDSKGGQTYGEKNKFWKWTFIAENTFAPPIAKWLPPPGDFTAISHFCSFLCLLSLAISSVIEIPLHRSSVLVPIFAWGYKWCTRLVDNHLWIFVHPRWFCCWWMWKKIHK